MKLFLIFFFEIFATNCNHKISTKKNKINKLTCFFSSYNLKILFFHQTIHFLRAGASSFSFKLRALSIPV